MKNLKVRVAISSDAPDIVELIHTVLRISNTPDYGAESIERVASHFTTETVGVLIERCFTLVAETAGKIIGTASIGPSINDPSPAIRTFFVDPKLQRCGVGNALLDHIERRAISLGQKRLSVRSSIAGEPFYKAAGYITVQDHWENDERTIELVKTLI